jgi:acyl carrier protein
MDLVEFTKAIELQFEEEINLFPDSEFRENDYFDSLVGMSMLVMIKDCFDYSMDVDVFLSCKTPRDLYENIVSNKR